MSILTSLRAVSYLAPNWFGLYQAIAAYLGRVLQLEIQLHLGERLFEKSEKWSKSSLSIPCE
ncbi:hypothetical protein [uncultured Nostoc sp.]|uniref:hypothetical protein n=1 Tax=uncultured Nostoc sp. TaxID=340711 RepID=UPI0035C957A1